MTSYERNHVTKNSNPRQCTSEGRGFPVSLENQIFDADVYKCKEDESETHGYAVCEGYDSSTSERETSVTRLIH